MKLVGFEISREIIEYIIGFVAIVAFYMWLYYSLSPGWRFFGMVLLSLIFGVAVQLLLIFFSGWRSKKIEKNRASSMCRSIAVHEESNDPEDAAKCWRYMISRYSSDLLANRLSDLIGILITPLSTIIGIGLSIWYFVMVAYFTWNGHYSEPYLLWIPLFFRIVAIICELLIGFICNVLFNRYPGEARRFNKNYDELRKTDALLSSKEFRESISG
ncbi:hypothetical protein [Serratia fonticola]